MYKLLPLILSAACASSTPEPAVPANDAPEAAQEQPEAAPVTEVVEVPWDGDVVQPDPEMCPEPHERAMDESAGEFRRIEIRRKGLVISETGFYREGDVESVELEVGGCTHETATFTFTISDRHDPSDEQYYVDRARKLLVALPLKDRGPMYVKTISEAFLKGTPDQDARNVLYNDSTMIIWAVNDAGGGKVTVALRYDFAQ